MLNSKLNTTYTSVNSMQEALGITNLGPNTTPMFRYQVSKALEAQLRGAAICVGITEENTENVYSLSRLAYGTMSIHIV